MPKPKTKSKPAKLKTAVKTLIIKKKKLGLMWECEHCGKIEYSDDAPEECAKCHQLDSYIKVPQEIVEEREKEMAEEEI